MFPLPAYQWVISISLILIVNRVSSMRNTYDEKISTTLFTPLFDGTHCETLPSGYYKYRNECNAYILCHNSLAELKYCKEGKVFNEVLQICDTESCIESEPVMSSVDDTVVNKDMRSSVLRAESSADKLCADQEQGTSYPLESDCQKYILCMGNGESVVVNCIYNAWYDPISGNCGPNVSPTACQDYTTSTETPTTTLETTTELPNVADLCPVMQGQYVAYPDNCSKYIVCADPVPIAFYCTPGYYFSESAQQCVDWEESDCVSMNTTPLPPGHTSPTQAPSICTGNTGGTLPYPEDCQLYIRCVNDNVYMMSACNNAEYYDISSGKCSPDVSANACREGYVSTTTEATTETTTEATTEATTETTMETSTLTTTQATTESSTAATTIPDSTTAEPDPCEGVDEGRLVPYPNDCTKFIQCENPTSIVYDCVEGQEFSARLERCMSPWVANCTYGKTTTANPFTTTEATDTTEFPDYFCIGKPEDTYVPYPHNCTKFIVCRDPIPVGYDCPAGTEFSPIELVCMDPQLANCQPGNMV